MSIRRCAVLRPHFERLGPAVAHLRPHRTGLARLGLIVALLGTLAVSAAIAPSPPADAQEPLQAHLLANLDRDFDRTAAREVEAPVAVAHGLVFTWAREAASRELWVTDGTGLGTHRLCGPNPDLCVHLVKRLASPPGLLYFLDDRILEQDRALWRTDGTEEGTFPVTSPARTRLEELLFFDSHLHAASGPLYFVAADAARESGLEPWVTDGTVAGTRQVLDLAAGPLEESSAPVFGASLGERVIFSAEDGDGDREPWVTDGTPEGTFELLDVTRGRSSFPFNFVTLADRVLFFVQSTSGGVNLWRTDGLRDGVTERVSHFSPDLGFPDPTIGPVLGDRVLFVLSGRLWATNGTAAGTGPLLDPAADSAADSAIVSGVRVVGRRGIFAVRSFEEGDQVWVSDGTPEGTRLLVDPCPGLCNAQPDGFHALGSQAVFSMTTGPSGRELWITDGTPGGTRQLADLCPGSCSSRPEVVGHLGGFLWVSADGGDGRELWRVRIASGEAAPLTDLELPGPFAGAPDGGLLHGGLVFSAMDPDRGQALWTSDGTALGTRPYFTLAPLTDGGSSPSGFTLRGREVFFGARTPEPGLWATDGTRSATRRVWTPPTEVVGIDRVVRLGGAQGPLLLTVENAGQGQVDLYRSDGTAAGTVRLARDFGQSIPSILVNAGDRIFYLAEGEPNLQDGIGVWVSDGTVEGTRRILRLSALRFLGARMLGPKLLFIVDPLPGGIGTNLWVSDGTPEGTHPVLDLDPPPFVGPSDPTVLGSLLFFSAQDLDDPDLGAHLWVTDGTSEGTRRVTDTGSKSPSSPRDLRVTGGRLFFTAPAPDDESLRLLWHSDGTPQGTRPFDSPVGPLAASGLEAVGPRLIFFGRAVQPTGTDAGTDADLTALWLTDGTPEGTRRLAAVRRQVTAVDLGGSLFFIEEDPPPFFPPEFPAPPDMPARLWHSDGTAEGTVPLDLPTPEALPWSLGTFAGHPLLVTINDEWGRDLWLLDDNGKAVTRIGRFDSIDGVVLQLGRRVLFSATRPETGSEPWVFELPAGPPAARRLPGP